MATAQTERGDVHRRGGNALSPLMIAAGLGERDTVASLLEQGADPNQIDAQMGVTALHKAAQSGDAGIIALLIDHGAFVDQQSPVLGNTPLIDAVLHKQEEAVRLILARRARTTIRNHWQQSALDLARENGSDTIARILEARDAADAKSVERQTLIAAVKGGDTTEVQRLVAAGTDLDLHSPVIGQLDDGYTALGVAVREQQTEIVEILLYAGADMNRVIGLMRGTVVHEASFLGFTEILRQLLRWHEKNGDLPAALCATGPYNGLTPLHDAVWHGHFDAAKLLAEAGAPLSARTHTGLTPRDMALLYDYRDLAQMLAGFDKARG